MPDEDQLYVETPPQRVRVTISPDAIAATPRAASHAEGDVACRVARRDNRSRARAVPRVAFPLIANRTPLPPLAPAHDHVSTSRPPHAEHTSRSRHSGTGISAPYRCACSAESGST